MIYTGYYKRLKDYDDCYKIAISGSVPDFYTGCRWKELAPRYEMWKEWKEGNLSDMDYTYHYKNWLDKLDKQELKNKINNILQYEEGKDSTTSNIIFLCYEKGGFCHRHILADWIEENLGMRVEEYK